MQRLLRRAVRPVVDTIFGADEPMENEPALDRKRKKEEHIGPLGQEEASQLMKLWKELADEVGKLSSRF